MNVADDCPIPFLWAGVNHSTKRSFISVSNYYVHPWSLDGAGRWIFLCMPFDYFVFRLPARHWVRLESHS
jgi:hypothetical protein